MTSSAAHSSTGRTNTSGSPLWLFTTFSCLLQLRVEVLECLHAGPYRFITDVFNFFDVVSMFSQATINALFLLRDEIPGALYSTANLTELAARRLAAFDDDGRGVGIHMGVYAADVADVAAWDAAAWDDGLLHGRFLKAGAGSSSSATANGLQTGVRPSLYIILQAVVSLLSIIRLLFYFKGNLRLGALVHTIWRIFGDIVPLGVLIGVLTLAFWSAIYLMMSIELTEEESPEWHSITGSFLIMYNMGLYTDIDKKMTHYERYPIALVLFHTYMLLVQVILLNMLIAIMGESNAAVREVSELVAQFERAQLILKWERRLASSLTSHRPDSRLNRIVRLFSGLPSDCSPKALESAFPPWIHVLMPPKRGPHGNDDRDGDNDELASVASRLESQAARTQMDRVEKYIVSSQEESRRMVQSLTELVETNHRQLVSPRLSKSGRNAADGGGASLGPAIATIPTSKHSTGDARSFNSWLGGIFTPKASCDARSASQKSTAPLATGADDAQLDAMIAELQKLKAKRAQERATNERPQPPPAAADALKA